MSTVGELRRQAADLLIGSGMQPEHAERCAQLLVLAEAWGIASHGLLRLPYYLERMAAGGCRPDAELKQISDQGAVVVYDGDTGLGHWQLWEAAVTAKTRCGHTGIAAVAVRNSSHCGALGAYVYPAVEAGMVSLVFSNGPAVMPPWGGHTPVLSTSPLAAGVPSRPHPLVLDLATSAVARGKIAARARGGEPLEEGWAFDADGRPTTDAQAALHGMLAPLGGAKGYGLALLVEMLTAGLVGPTPAADMPDMFTHGHHARPQGIGHLVVTMTPEFFDSEGADRFDRLARRIADAGGRLPGRQRVAPSDLDDAFVLDVAPATLQELDGWAHRLSNQA
ncbi:Ldh family oxidoreductase [Saccharopolyspora phatthalungensis]|uniref:(2R)-3-sulfolactate dehydrogenase (NADP+) n=1 Tax=Saccharopolyspora phatthalungensis TaxID=664693 RepID=A0A840QGC2_9PSEU|nr:Ldh family oxidoreductase [Saccharopolyspora phatthalungensis]MBB5157659.1 (2R)-3-sulfolactate dehydrogenase (NADP+) [Saccharopolyspora phatthalungensis]